jgi:hypothetical protein
METLLPNAGFNVPADFDTIEKTSPGSNLSKKA